MDSSAEIDFAGIKSDAPVSTNGEERIDFIQCDSFHRSRFLRSCWKDAVSEREGYDETASGL